MGSQDKADGDRERLEIHISILSLRRANKVRDAAIHCMQWARTEKYYSDLVIYRIKYCYSEHVRTYTDTFYADYVSAITLLAINVLILVY